MCTRAEEARLKLELTKAKQFTPIEEAPPYRPKYGDAAYFRGKNSPVWIWCVFEWEEDCGQLMAEIFSEDPPPEDHWLGWWIDGCGLDETIGCSWDLVQGVHWYKEEWLLTEGIAPNQPFLVELKIYSYEYDTYYGREYDCEVTGEVIDIKSWLPEQVLAAWEEHLPRTGMIHET